MSEITRRDALGRLALAFAMGAAIDELAAREVHTMLHQGAAAAGGTAGPKALAPQQFRTLERLTDLIIPPDGEKPGALAVGVPAWIDSLLAVNEELKGRYTAGLAWLDTTMKARHGSDFASATSEWQTALLDQIAYQKNRSPELDPGVDFFILVRRMTVDGFYTSATGMRDLYPGNVALAEYKVPQEAYDFVLSRSPLK